MTPPLAATERGKAVVRLLLPQTDLGFVYIPLIHDEALKYEIISLDDLSILVEQ